MTALNLGCGSKVFKQLEGCDCINIDIRELIGVDLICDVRKLPFDAESIAYILADDIIEHFPLSETLSILREWSRVLSKNGKIKIRTPNLNWICEHYVQNKNNEFTSLHIFGGQNYKENYHYVLFDKEFLSKFCKKAGLEVIQYREVDSNFELTCKKT